MHYAMQGVLCNKNHYAMQQIHYTLCYAAYAMRYAMEGMLCSKNHYALFFFFFFFFFLH